MAIKWFYLAPRAACLAPENFPSAWLGHAKLAAQFPDLLRWFDASLYCLPAPNTADDHDSVAALELADMEAIKAVLAHPLMVSKIQPDERRIFADIIPRFSLAAHAELLSEAAIGKIARFAFLKPGVPAPVFSELLRHSIRQRLLPIGKPGSVNCAVNWVVPNAFESVHRHRAVVEYYAEETADWDRWAAFIGQSPWVGAGGIFTGGRIIMNWRRSGAN